MKAITRPSLPALAIVFILPFSVVAQAAESTAHKHDHAAAPHAATAKPEVKWASDPWLHKAMADIRNAMAGALPAIHQGKLAAAKYGALSQRVKDQVDVMTKNCNLAPDADERLHLIIGDLLEGAEAMAGGAGKATRQDGAVRIAAAVDQYLAYFDDRELKPLKH